MNYPPPSLNAVPLPAMIAPQGNLSLRRQAASSTALDFSLPTGDLSGIAAAESRAMDSSTYSEAWQWGRMYQPPQLCASNASNDPEGPAWLGHTNTPTGSASSALRLWDIIRASTASIQERVEQAVAEDVAQSAEALFVGARMERFEDGYESRFARELSDLISRMGNAAVFEVEQLLLNPSSDPDVASEALRVLARSQHAPSKPRRRKVVEAALGHLNATIRDGAIVALSLLRAPESENALRAAMRVEPIPELRREMQRVLNLLRSH